MYAIRSYYEQYSNVRSFGSGIGYFRVYEAPEHYIITTGNKILSEHNTILRQNSEEINRLGEEELRELKRKTRTQANIRDIGAHIGLIQTGLLTGNQIELKFDPIDELYSYFTISAKVNKEI